MVTQAEKAKAKQRYISGVISGVQKQRISPHLGPGAAFATGVKEAGKAQHAALARQAQVAKRVAAKIAAAAAKRRDLKEQKNLAAANRAKIAAAKLAAARASRAELIRDAAAIVKAKVLKKKPPIIRSQNPLKKKGCRKCGGSHPTPLHSRYVREFRR
jgi:hypothetical protein